MTISNTQLVTMMARAIDMMEAELSEARLVVDAEEDFTDLGSPLCVDDDVLRNASPTVEAIETVMTTMLKMLNINTHENRLLIAGTLLAGVAVEASAVDDGTDVFDTSAYALGAMDPNNVFDKATILAFAAMTLGIANGIGDLMDSNEEEDSDDEALGHQLDEEMIADIDAENYGKLVAQQIREAANEVEVDPRADDDEDEFFERMAREHARPKVMIPPQPDLAKRLHDSYPRDDSFPQDAEVHDHTHIVPSKPQRGMFAPDTGADNEISMDDIPHE